MKQKNNFTVLIPKHFTSQTLCATTAKYFPAISVNGMSLADISQPYRVIHRDTDT